MRIFLGIFFATSANFLLGVLGYYLTVNLLPLFELNALINKDLNNLDYIFNFIHKFFVILALTWILYKVMPLLDKPRKRVLFIFFIGTIFAVYSEAGFFWSAPSLYWSLLLIISNSFNWLITGYVLSKFIKPKHLGAL
jgi:hypothetical protein|tara:strand:+ start:1247 stop:1660 length:414 start_codon:yes stop_codon:yes gene_type:complete